MTNHLLDAALHYAERGRSVFAVHDVATGKCSCGGRKKDCKPGKHPRTEHGVNDATTDAKIIRKWWAWWPNANIGLACEDELIVLDVDVESGGMGSFGALQERFGADIFDTVTSQSGGGGLHLVFQANGHKLKNDSQGLLGPGLHIKAKGGYIVAAPSLHPSGKRYAWKPGCSLDERPLAVFPDCLAELVETVKRKNRKSVTEEIEKVTKSHRHKFLLSVAGSLRNQGLDQAAILPALKEINQRKCEPPKSDDELAKMAASICQYPPGKQIIVDEKVEAEQQAKAAAEAARDQRSAHDNGHHQHQRESGDDTEAEPWTDDREEEAHGKAQAPQARPWLDIELAKDDKSVVVGPGRWLTRGSGGLIVAPTGAGKSTLCATLAFTWALGRDCLGFHPTSPLKSLIIQAEDDDGDLVDMRAGVLSVLRPTEAEREILRNSVLVVTERAKTGVDFLRLFVRPLLKQFSPDIFWLNPLSAYFGADLNDQEQVAKFFRNTLNPILAETHCLAMIPHHIAKPSKERKDWTGGELAYLGAGSADLANWAREIIALRATAPGLYEMACTKRGRKLDWRDADGKQTSVRMIAHGSDGQMVWRDADAQTLSEAGAQPYSDAALLGLVPDEGLDKQVLITDVEGAFAVCQRTAQRYVNDACRLRRRMVNGQQFRVALLVATERPRKEVYPTEAKNRPVVWVRKVR